MKWSLYIKHGFLVVFFFLFPLSVKADDSFSTNYQVTYRYDTSGKSTVHHNVAITNKKSEIYVSSYQLILSGESINSISASDGAGPISVKTKSPNSNTTVVDLDFNQPVVGINKTLEFEVIYQGTPALHTGQVWELSLPKLAEPNKFDEYSLTLMVPASFGKPAYISPSPAKTQDRTFTFTKQQISRVGVVAAFGNFQTYGFNIVYTLKNPRNSSTTLEVAIPPDTSLQRVFYDVINPRPSNIRLDKDGNWLASFEVGGRKELQVRLAGQARLLPDPIMTIGQSSPVQLSDYLQATPNWPANSSTFKTLGSQLKTPQAIYEYVIDYLQYDYSRIAIGVKRKGAEEAFSTPLTSLCTEFTDLFITLARAAGIPAREVNGYAYSSDARLRPISRVANIYHAWPQYWDFEKNTWISVDPTWGDTTGGIDYFNKLDLNHLALVIHGQSDTEPHLAASEVQIELTDYKEYAEVQPTLKWHVPWQIWPKIGNKLSLEITNNQGFALHRLPVTVISEGVSNYTPTAYIETLPPFVTTNLDIYLKTGWAPMFDPASVQTTLGTQTIAYNIPQSRFLGYQLLIGCVVASFIITVAVVAYKAWGVHLQRH